MNEELKDALNVLWTVQALLDGHECKQEKMDSFPFPICKLCAANDKIEGILSKYEDGNE